MKSLRAQPDLVLWTCFAAACAFLTLSASESSAQCPGQWLPQSASFSVYSDSGPSVTGMLAADLDGSGIERLVVFGNFTAVDGGQAWGVASFDGQAWHAVGTSVLLRQTSAGLVNAVGGVVSYRGELISARLNPNGVVHLVNNAWVPLGSGGPSVQVTCLAAGADFLYVGGTFGIMRWDGAQWESIAPASVPPVSPTVLAVVYGSLYAGWTVAFPAPRDGGQAAVNFGRWDGADWRSIAGNTLTIHPRAIGGYQGSLVVGDWAGLEHVRRLVNGAWTIVGPWDQSFPPGSILIDTMSFAEFAGDLYAAGLIRYPCLESILARFDGSAWQCIPDPSPRLLMGTSLFVLNDELFLGGVAQSTPGPALARWSFPSADFNHDGDAATDADIEAFFACIAGNCCPACGSADFNGDGDVGTDADIEAFFRVLAGGTC